MLLIETKTLKMRLSKSSKAIQRYLGMTLTLCLQPVHRDCETGKKHLHSEHLSLWFKHEHKAKHDPLAHQSTLLNSPRNHIPVHVSPTDPCPGLVKTWAACLMGEEAAKQDMYEPFIAAGRTIRRSSAALQATENMLSEFYSHHVRRPKSSSGTIWVHKCIKTLLKTGKIHPYSTYG